MQKQHLFIDRKAEERDRATMMLFFLPWILLDIVCIILRRQILGNLIIWFRKLIGSR